MATTCTKCGRRVTRVYGDGTGCYSRGDLDCERALTASLRTQLAAATERYESAVALHDEVRGRLTERLALTPIERAVVEDCRTLPERVPGPWPIATRLLAIIDRIAPPKGQ